MFIVGNHRFYGVLSTGIDLIWDEVKPLLEKAIEYADGKYSADDIYQQLLEKTMQLWVVYNDKGLVCCVITQIYFYPQAKRLGILFLSSLNLKDVMPFWDVLAEFARSKGCDGVEIYGRPGWEKALQNIGFRKIHTVLRANI